MTDKYLYLYRPRYDGDPREMHIVGWGTEVPSDAQAYVKLSVDEGEIEDLIHFLIHPTLAEKWISYLKVNWQRRATAFNYDEDIIEAARILAESGVPVPNG
jgi:hypothetical protein